MPPSASLSPSPPQPLVTTLQARADALRAALKDYERAFAAQHNGRKPTKEDIKADTEVAMKYREYNKVRDAIAGKAKPDGDRDGASPKRKREGQQTLGEGKGGKKRKVEGVTPRRGKGNGKSGVEEGRVGGHGDDDNVQDEEQEDAPEDLLPIGPTPQRDGTVLGIFDLMSNPPGSGSTYGMGTPRRRRGDCHDATQSHDATTQRAAAGGAGAELQPDAALITATPQRSRRQNHQGDLLQHLAATPATGSRAKHSRTPISEGRKFMLSQFFATPSTVRYQQIIHMGETPEAKEMVQTPLKNNGDGNDVEEGRVKDETPRYLKRTASFRDRLLSASSSSPSLPGRSGMLDSEWPGRTGPVLVKAKAKAKFQPKPLSQIAAELLKQRPAETQQEGNHGVDVDDDDEDDMEALRELEDAEMNALSADEEQQQQQQQQIPRAVYKKKGLKRQTRRVVMKPQPKLGRNKKNDNNDNDNDDNDDDDDDEEEGQEDVNSDGWSEDDEGNKPVKSKAERGKGKGKKNKASDGNENEADAVGGGEIRTYDPNAVTHMNFKSLKIKNKNSKGKFRGRGGGRFGRARHR